VARRRRPRSDPYAPRRFEPLEPLTAPEAMARRYERRVDVSPVTHGSNLVTDEPPRRRPSFWPQRRPSMLQGFGSTEDRHTAEGNRAAQAAKDQAIRGVDRAEAGDCNTARRYLSAAHGSIGHAVAHSASGGRVEITTATSTVDRAEEHFSRACKITKRRK
jgi:hypothetical protein